MARAEPPPLPRGGLPLQRRQGALPLPARVRRHRRPQEREARCYCRMLLLPPTSATAADCCRRPRPPLPLPAAAANAAARCVPMCPCMHRNAGCPGLGRYVPSKGWRLHAGAPKPYPPAAGLPLTPDPPPSHHPWPWRGVRRPPSGCLPQPHCVELADAFEGSVVIMHPRGELRGQMEGQMGLEGIVCVWWWVGVDGEWRSRLRVRPCAMIGPARRWSTSRVRLTGGAASAPRV